MRPIGLPSLGVVLATTLAVATGKPGYPDKVNWSGLTWAVKTSRSAVGPGPNLFEKSNVSVDSRRLVVHLHAIALARTKIVSCDSYR